MVIGVGFRICDTEIPNEFLALQANIRRLQEV